MVCDSFVLNNVNEIINLLFFQAIFHCGTVHVGLMSRNSHLSHPHSVLLCPLLFRIEMVQYSDYGYVNMYDPFHRDYVIVYRLFAHGFDSYEISHAMALVLLSITFSLNIFLPTFSPMSLLHADH